MTPLTTRREWRAADLTIVTYQHAHEARTRPGSFQSPVPSAGDVSGVVFGHFFELDGPEQQPERIGKKILAEFGSAGPSSFRGLNGMWAAVIWDRARRQAHFARDVVGGQVLYVAQLDGRIVFATDLRIFQASGMLGALDEQAVAEFLHYLYVAAPRALAQGCSAVLPGHVLSIGAGVRQEKYAAPRFVRGRALENPDDVAREIEKQLPVFEEKLLTAVADCIPDSGRFALTLSGGKDSSVLAVALSKICPDRVLALTVGQSDERLNEAHDAALVCRSLGLSCQTYVPTGDSLAQGLYDFASLQDQPIGDPAALPYFLGMSQLPEDCTVVIDGTGNDYYFGMSNIPRTGWVRRRVDVQKYVPDVLWPFFLRLMSFGPQGLRQLSRSWSRPIEESFVAWDGWSTSELSQLFGRDISFADTYLWQVMQYGDSTHWPTLHTETVGNVWEPHTAYRKAIHFAHALGKGIRFPFIDNRLASFVNGLPEQLQSGDGVNKIILRAYMKKNLPREITDKPKRGFIFDLNQLLMNPSLQWFNKLERAGALRLLPTRSERPIREVLARHERAPDDPRWQHRLYSLCLLLTVLAVKGGYDPGLNLRKQRA